MQLNLKNKSVIVTGAASNIGRGIALAFAEEGAAVAIADIDESRAHAVADEAVARGASKSMAVKTDVSNWAEVQAMAERVESAFGSVDILVNNAGWVVDRLFVEKPRAEWEKEVQINLWGMINCTRAVLDGMISRSGGAVVSIASDAGRIGEFREGSVRRLQGRRDRCRKRWRGKTAGTISVSMWCAREPRCRRPARRSARPAFGRATR